jgi:hypothetical protein
MTEESGRFFEKNLAKNICAFSVRGTLHQPVQRSRKFFAELVFKKGDRLFSDTSLLGGLGR